MSSAGEVFAQWFAERHWRVLTEATGLRQQLDAAVAYKDGKFVISGGEFLTPLGTPAGTEGYLVQEQDPLGNDLPVMAAFREDVLRKAEALYGTVAGLPALAGDQA